MTRPHGHPLGSVAATLALSDWERRTALAAPDYDPDETEDDDPGADLPEWVLTTEDDPTPGYSADCFICADHDASLPQCQPCPSCTDRFGIPCGHIPADDTRCDFGHDFTPERATR